MSNERKVRISTDFLKSLAEEYSYQGEGVYRYCLKDVFSNIKVQRSEKFISVAFRNKVGRVFVEFIFTAKCKKLMAINVDSILYRNGVWLADT